MPTNVDTFISFINSNWNKKSTIYRASDLQDYVPGVPMNPNTADSGNPLYALSGDFFFDNATSVFYYRSTEVTNPWRSFGSAYSSAYSNQTGIKTGVQVGHLDPNTTIDEIKSLSLSELFDKILFKEYTPVIKPVECIYGIYNNSIDVTDGSLEVGSTFNLTFGESTYLGEWYINELNLKINDYAIGLDTVPYNYFRVLTGGNTPINNSFSAITLEGENNFLVQSKLKGINAKVNNLGTVLSPSNPNTLFSTSALNIKRFFGRYYTFIASGNNTILTANPRTWIGNGKTVFKGTNPIYFSIDAGNKYAVVYCEGNHINENSYRLDIVNESNQILENNIRFNNTGSLTIVPTANGTNVTYTKFVFSSITNISRNINFKLTLL